MLFDNLNTHKSGAVKCFVAEHHPRLSLEYFSAYAPELHAAEWLWRHLKRIELPNSAPKDVHDLRDNMQRAMVRVRKRARVRRSFIEDSERPL